MTGIQFVELPVIFGPRVGPPVLPGLVVDVPLEPSVTMLQGEEAVRGKWKGLPPREPREPKEPREPREPKEAKVVSKVILPDISSRIVPIPELQKRITTQPRQLKQEKVLEVLNEIDIDTLEDSIIHPKGGYPLRKLKSFAKQLGISTAELRKAGIAKRILEKIKLKGEED